MGLQTDNRFDILGLTYAHFPSEIGKQAHNRLLIFLKPGGKVIFEIFAKEQLKKACGGPKNLNMLFVKLVFQKPQAY